MQHGSDRRIYVNLYREESSLNSCTSWRGMLTMHCWNSHTGVRRSCTKCSRRMKKKSSRRTSKSSKKIGIWYEAFSCRTRKQYTGLQEIP